MAKSPLLHWLRTQASVNVEAAKTAYMEAAAFQSRTWKIRTAQLSFKVTIVSMWADHGGKDAEVTVRGSLEEAMRQAIGQFQQLNNCKDVQGTYRVVVILPGTPPAAISLPQSSWEHLTWK